MNKFKETVIGDKKNLSVIMMLAGVAVIIVSFLLTNQRSVNTGTSYDQKDELEIYGEKLENKIENAVCTITGENTVEVVITFSSTFETVYAENVKTDGTSSGFYGETAIAPMSGSDGKSPVIVKKNCPKISGVMIVCKKAMDKQSYTAIKKAAATALNISESKIYIIGGEARK